MTFDETKLYPTDDPELLKLFSRSTLAGWRHEKKGPAYLRVGKRCFYHGRDLNAFLSRNRIETRDSGLAERHADFAA